MELEESVPHGIRSGFRGTLVIPSATLHSPKLMGSKVGFADFRAWQSVVRAAYDCYLFEGFCVRFSDTFFSKDT